MSTLVKKACVFFALLLMTAGAFAQDDAIGKFFGKYVDDTRFTIVSVSPKMFRLLSKVNWDSIPPDVRQTVTRLHSLRILSTGTTPRQFYKEAMSRIDMKEYEELITIRDKNDDVRFVIKEAGGVVHELLMVAADEDGFTMISFVGDIDLEKLSRLSGSMNIKGMDGLRNAKRKNK